MKEQAIRSFAATLAILLGSVGQSNAATLTLPGQNTDVDLSAASTFSGVGGGVTVSVLKTLTFAKFDPTLGTLTSVQIAFNSLGAWDVAVRASGRDPDADLVYGGARSDFALVVTADGFTGDLLNTVNDHRVDCDSPGSTCNEAVYSVPSSEDSYYFLNSLSNAAALADFVASVGSATFDVRVDASLMLTFLSCSGSCTASASYSLDGQRIPADGRYPEVAVTYEYTEAAIPEPGTLALFGLGLAGLGAMRRKKLAA